MNKLFSSITNIFSKWSMRQKFSVLIIVSIIVPLALTITGYQVMTSFLVDAEKSYMVVKASQYRAAFVRSKEAYLYHTMQLLYHRAIGEEKDATEMEIERDAMADAAMNLSGELLGSGDDNLKAIARSLDSNWSALEQRVNSQIEDAAEGKKDHRQIDNEVDGIVELMTAFVADLDKVDATFQKQAMASYSYAYKAKSVLWWVIGGILGFIGLYSVLALIMVIRATRQIQEVSLRLNTNVDRLVNASGVLSAGGQQLSAATNEQAAAVHESVSSATEIQSMVQKTTAKTEEFIVVSDKVNSYVENGMAVLVNLVESMKEIKEMSDNLSQISGIIDNIAEKTKVINDIVFKTQLLSFNASIEAARAGQHGRGFSVVAEEVGNLAQMSGNAANAIDHLIKDSRTQVHRFLEQSGARVERGEQVTREIEQVYQNIASELVEMKAGLDVVRQANVEQMGGLEQVTKAMQQISSATQQSEEAVRGLLSLAGDLTEESQTVHGLSLDLKRVVDGEGNLEAAAQVAVSHKHTNNVVSMPKAPGKPAKPGAGAGVPRSAAGAPPPAPGRKAAGGGHLSGHLDDLTDDMFRKLK